jgi:drug/metabolite transporter (DMT)-like permease
LISIFTIAIGLIAYYSREAGISPAVVLSLSILSSFTTALAFYFIYNEKLNSGHWIGMLCIMISVAVIALSKSSSGESEGTKEVVVN